MRFSLIVATKDRPDKLKKLISSLTEQIFLDFELIVVDQGSDNNAQRVVYQFGNKIKLQYITQSKLGLSIARNEGIKFARGEIIAFPDDDCWYSPSLLYSVNSWFSNNPQYSFVSGHYGEPSVPGPYPKVPDDINFWNVFKSVSSVSIFIRRSDVQDLYFDERLGAGTKLPACEELDYVVRMLSQGKKGFYEPSIKVFHPLERISLHDLNRDKAFGFMLVSLIRSMNGFWRVKILVRFMTIFIMLSFRSLLDTDLRHRFSYFLRGISLAINITEAA